MKKLILIFTILLKTSYEILAQAPPPPPGNAGTGGGPIGAGPVGAPLNDGLYYLFIFALLYVAWHGLLFFKTERLG